jgi:tetratricopeptide (TPR) repeat protein
MKLAALFSLAALAYAQGPAPDLMATMQNIARSLGVTCEYCHSAPRGSGQSEPKKEIARAMMAMTREINGRIDAAAGKTATGVTRVDCITCHRGVAVPRELSALLIETLSQKGVTAAVAQYRDLRKRYYGSAAYDFSEDTLLGIAQRITTGRPDDAIALLQLNLEFHPQSARSYAAIGYAYTRKLDDTSAMASFEKALEIEPDNGIVRGQLEQLRSYHRKR